MLLLAIDTSTSAITVAVHDGTRIVATESVVDARAHAEHLTPATGRVLAVAEATPADVTAVVVGTGPGPFTGLRVGLASGHVFGWARQVPVHGLCSLDALAHRLRLDCGEDTPERFLVATDARRKEVYSAVYTCEGQRIHRLGDPRVGRAADLPDDERDLPCVGRGPLLYPHDLPRPLGPLDVDAGALADLAAQRLAAGETLDRPEPLYLRRPDAVPSQPKSVLAARTGNVPS
ncbi:hypothetical protein KEM60_01859 [Austwickia sp. TVS 96-490-7B]|uniref:tRNA (adenosine(37)-N6)-threonylcarbamoyltransferase complex dimerization subunit type 1 TsaB n=1 Tax=Austwickia sp. TVS 96-490-7B TaxID=2830843 RepID=UPI001C577556|nr:tRNA (adenosine(37)-N6)-threonylcarbamoyltransferase complex dimerization subunit type 1 TsaB [Austwickia sp. TVS 96-490-7B]MBW3085655.1 hypothetical protein [Austwickia sp. TVS 96-490-7B]